MTTAAALAGREAPLHSLTGVATRAAQIVLALVVAVVAASEVASAQTPSAETPGAADQTAPSGQAPRPVSSTRLTWAVSERARYSGLFNQFRPGLSGDDRAVVFRTTVKAELRLPQVTLAGEVQDARAYFTDARSNVSTSLVNAIDLLQAYVWLGPTTTTRTTTARVPEVQIGRFSMELGSGRLVAQEAYRDVTRTFTGAKVRWPRIDGNALTAFAVLPVVTLPENRDGLLHNRIELDTQHLNQKFWGAHYERERLWLGARAEVYLYALGEHDDPGKRETRDRKLWTTGVRLLRPAKIAAWDVDVESAWQRGRAHASSAAADRRALQVSARLLHLQASYTFDRPWSPRVGVEYDYGSGDANPADSQWNRFDGLFGHRRVELGPTSIYGALGRENVDTVGVRASVAPSSRTDAFAVYRVVRLAAAADAFASTGVRDPTGRSGRDGGQQIDGRFRAWIKPGVLRLELGITRLIAGHFLRVAPNATGEGNTTFFYGDVTYSLASKSTGINK
jgi:hypothetical protein